MLALQIQLEMVCILVCFNIRLLECCCQKNSLVEVLLYGALYFKQEKMFFSTSQRLLAFEVSFSGAGEQKWDHLH